MSLTVTYREVLLSVLNFEVMNTVSDNNKHTREGRLGLCAFHFYIH